ncbi:hypothetical protein NQ315_014113 [Exocentrus adspersus]|uniref:Uncharacterized protein n=1 Tax=Exocentrus adspersus TaxID=1586481 RepID=A0AAV8VVH5_9CUCU|nr:hypothetical protein NQ315_014113 [Exocentrus adspersus]
MSEEFEQETKKELKEVIKRLEEQSVKRGLRIYEKKTKYKEWTEEEYQEGRFLKVETNTGKKYEFEEVEQFTYLGSIFSRKPNIGEEIDARIMAGNRCVAGLRRILRNKNISRQTKIRLYKTDNRRQEGKRTTKSKMESGGGKGPAAATNKGMERESKG